MSGELRFTSVLAWEDDGPDETVLYRLDYLPRREFDRIKARGAGAEMFAKSRALRLGRLVNNLYHAMILDERVEREVEHLAYVAAMIRSHGNVAQAESFGSSRMKAALQVQGKVVTPVPKGLWLLKRPEMRRPNEEESEEQ